MEKVLSWLVTIVVIPNIITVYSGWDLISVPYIQTIPFLDQVLMPINSEYDAVQTYVSSDHNDHWKHFEISKPSDMNDLAEITCEIGFWISITNTSIVKYFYQDSPPSKPKIIRLNDA
jgi:hypothetical protein